MKRLKNQGRSRFIGGLAALQVPRELIKGVDGANELEKIQNGYGKFYEPYKSEIGHYFRTLYHTVRFVDQSSTTDRGKKDYAGLLRAQFFSSELLLLFYNGLSKYGWDKLKPLIEEYARLEQVPTRELLSPNHASRVDLYKPQACHDQ